MGRIKHANLSLNNVIQYCYPRNTTRHGNNHVARSSLWTQSWSCRVCEKSYSTKILDSWVTECFEKYQKKCVFCRKLCAQNKTPLMADLPPERPDFQSFPFTNIVVDYFCPFEIRVLRRSMKSWCCFFTYLTTRAFHIEILRSLNTDSCLEAINRFIARLGKPTIIISDNGTKENINSWNHDQLTSELAPKHVEWMFNPPGVPHFGGVWKRLVRSCKKAMVAILGNRSFTDEVLLTTMCLVEHTLNARPFTPASDDPENLEALTPNHFFWVVRRFAFHLFQKQRLILIIERCLDRAKLVQTKFWSDGRKNTYLITM